jgi:hypothetical protein
MYTQHAEGVGYLHRVLHFCLYSLAHLPRDCLAALPSKRQQVTL